MKTKRHIAAAAAAVMVFQIGTAYAEQYPVYLSELKFGEAVTAEGRQDFKADEVYGWSGVNNTEVTAEEEEGNYFLSAENTDASAKISADFGRELFLKAAPKGTFYWDFEDKVTFTDDNLGVKAIDATGVSTGDFIDKIAYGEDVVSPEESATDTTGKWTGVIYNPDDDHWRISPVYTPIENVLTYNNIVRLAGTLTGSGVTYGAPDTADPAENSKQVCVVRSDRLSSNDVGVRMLGIRVKLSKDMIEADKKYNLSYHIMNNGITGSESSKQMMMYAFFKPFSENDNMPIKSGNTNEVTWLDFSKYLTTTDGKVGAQRYWQRVETTIDLSDADFNEEGYTTLWIVVSGWLYSLDAQPKQVSAPAAGEYIYFDNIALSPADDELRESKFSVNCSVKGSAGDKVELSLNLDGDRELIKKTITLANDGWNEISGSFEMNGDDDYVLGTNHGDTKYSNSGRVKMTIASTGKTVCVDDVLFMREVEDNFGGYGESSLIVSGKLYNSDETIDSAKFKASIYTDNMETSLLNKSLPLQKGINRFFTNMLMPEKEYLSDLSRLEYKLTNESGKVLSGNTGFDRFFANGVDILPPDTEELGGVMKLSGSGAYLAEFDVSGVTGSETITISCCGKTTTVKADADGAYQAEIEIDEVSDTARLDISAQTAEISNISIKKIAD